MERKLWEPLPGLKERIAFGKNKRMQAPREAHASVGFLSNNRPDPVALIIASNKNRLPELVPIRHQRMLTSAFAFFRGSAGIMAEDLFRTPDSGIRVQCCGDCHLLNFGGYATPERKQVFDINDFDETSEAPFEWDVKRLAASIALAGRYKGFPDKLNRKAVLEAVKMYAGKMRDYSAMRQLDIWYSCLDSTAILGQFKNDKEFVKRFKLAARKAKLRTHEFVFPKVSGITNGQRKIIDQPPFIYHLPDTDGLTERARIFFDGYFKTLSDDKRALLKRFRLADAAIKVVGVGSVGTRCYIALFIAEDEDAMILQFKEAGTSVLAHPGQKQVYKNNGSRIVNGQRLMQTVSDIFLGWTKDSEGRDFYIRQLRDMKSGADIEKFTPGLFASYALLCGWALAKSHAKGGMSPEITGYIGNSDVFAEAIADFALAYADQTKKDYHVFAAAARDKIIPVHSG